MERKGKGMIKKLTSNWGLKLASVVFAAILWFLITNINDPVVSQTFYDVPVTIKNTSLITENGQVYEVLDDTDVISTVKVYAPRTAIDSLSKDNIVATADVANMTSNYTIPISLSTNKYSNEIESISGSIDTVKLDVEDKATKTLALTATTSGTLEDGYIVGTVSTEQNLIRVSGPESIVSQIKSAVVDVDVTGFTSNIGTDADIKLYDEEGNVISEGNLTLNITSVRVNVTILETKRVPIVYTITGTPASGYQLTGVIDSTPDTILIAGRSSALSEVDFIGVSDALLNVQGLTENLETTIDLTDYLPSNISFGDSDFNGIVSVVVHIEETKSKTVDLDVSSFTISNVPEGYQVTIVTGEEEGDTTQSITVSGLQAALDTATASTITGEIDMQEFMDSRELDNLVAGTYSTSVDLTLPDGVSTSDSVSVQILITEE
jgi:YbbR domain-containing protein